MQSECSSSRTNGWWMIIIDLCMAIFGAAYIYSIHSKHNWILFLAPSLVSIVGLVALFIDLRCQQDKNKPYMLESALNMYVRAWHKIWQHKWILWLFGSIAAISSIAYIITEISKNILFQRILPGSYSSDFPNNWFSMAFNEALHNSFKYTISVFFPRCESIYQGTESFIFALVLLPILFISYRSLKNIANSDPADNIRLFRYLLIGITIICAVMLVDSSIHLIRVWTFIKYLIAKATAIHHHSGYHTMSQPTESLYSYILNTIASIIISTGLMGGLFGSLARIKRGENITTATFRRDALYYLLPLSGIYFATAMLVYLPYIVQHFYSGSKSYYRDILQLLIVSLMFVPIIVVAQHLKTWKATKLGLQYWKKSA